MRIDTKYNLYQKVFITSISDKYDSNIKIYPLVIDKEVTVYEIRAHYSKGILTIQYCFDTTKSDNDKIWYDESEVFGSVSEAESYTLNYNLKAVKRKLELNEINRDILENAASDIEKKLASIK